MSCNTYNITVPCAGEVGGVYNVIQDSTHQVSMRLKLGVLSDHNGTYIVRHPSPSLWSCTLGNPAVGRCLDMQ